MQAERASRAAAVLLAALSLAGTAHTATKPVVVAVVDTGVDASVPALAGRVEQGWAPAGRGAATTDGGWHGTAVASIIAAVDPDALVMPVKVLDAAGHAADAAIAQGVVWAVDHGAGVVNLSLTGPTETPALHDALRYAAQHGVVIVAAAGNGGTTAASFPAADPYAIGVAGVQQSGALSLWSNRGRWVRLAAPGVNAAVVPGGGSFDFAGTSSSAAVVSGAAALCLEAAPALSPTTVRRMLVATAARLPRLPFGEVAPARAAAACAGATP